MAKIKKSNETVQIDRRAADRREVLDRRQKNVPVEVDRRVEARRKTPRRRQIDPTTCERDYSTEEIEFMQAMDAYKRANGRMFPTCSEILEVIRGMGYVRVSNQAGFATEPNLEVPQTHSEVPVQSAPSSEIDRGSRQ